MRHVIPGLRLTVGGSVAPLCLRSVSSRRAAVSTPKQPCRQSHASVEVAPPYQRLSRFWIPTQSATRKQEDAPDKVVQHGATDYAQSLLTQAGFVRQTHAGIFHMLPLGQRVVRKVEAILDRHMEALGAAKTSLSAITSEDLWQRSGRLDGKDSELFHFQDRKKSKFLLAPTHEEEITSIAAQSVHSYKDLPLRLYQISRKYRDEPRPRAGLLRGREFLMKDLYTFDATPQEALATYDEVRTVYSNMFSELRLPFMSATADSGNMGGDLSHEFHFASPSGEDTILHCSDCEYSVNQEVVNTKAEHCPSCGSAKLSESKSIELGHTFHLGERYSKPLGLQIRDKDNNLVNAQMGCHGVGVSRLVAAVAAVKADTKGLNWPVIIAPFSVIVVPAKGAEAEALKVAELLGGKLKETSAKWDPTRPLDLAFDDRDKPFGWKLNDADLVGYPVIVIVGSAYTEAKTVEVQCRQLKIKENVLLSTHNGPQRIYDILSQL